MDDVVSVLEQGLPNMGSGAAGAGTLDFLRNSQQVLYLYPLFSLTHKYSFGNSVLLCIISVPSIASHGAG